MHLMILLRSVAEMVGLHVVLIVMKHISRWLT